MSILPFYSKELHHCVGPLMLFFFLNGKTSFQKALDYPFRFLKYFLHCIVPHNAAVDVLQDGRCHTPASESVGCSLHSWCIEVWSVHRHQVVGIQQWCISDDPSAAASVHWTSTGSLETSFFSMTL